MNQTNLLYFGEKSSFYKQVKELFSVKNIQLTRTGTLEEVVKVFEENPPSILIAEAGNEGVSGLSLCQEIRSRYQGLLVLLSRQENVEFHTLALGLGVDTSLKMGDGPQFVVANIHALLRRCKMLHPLKQLTFGDLTIDSSRRDVFIADQAAALSTIEFQLIWLLAKKNGSVVSRDEIHRELYKTNYNGYDRSIDLYISRIRQKIGDDPGTSQYLKTVRGVGYQFIPTNETKHTAAGI